MITSINQAKALTKHSSIDCKCKVDSKNVIYSKVNKSKCQCESKNPIKHHACKKEYV